MERKLGLEVREARNATNKVAPAELHVESLPRPVFAYAWQLVDDGNGDGLVQRGEKYHLQVSIKNTGMGASTKDAQVILRNATGDGVFRQRQSRHAEEKGAPPHASRTLSEITMSTLKKSVTKAEIALITGLAPLRAIA